jgi:O-antigen ligase
MPSPSSTDPAPFPFSLLLPALALNAIATPTLLAFNVSPSSTFLNQAAALIGWGLLAAWMTAIAGTPGRGAPLRTGWPVLSALLLMMLCALASWIWGSLPASLSWSACGLLFAAGVVFATAALVGAGPAADRAFRAFAFGLLVAGVLSTGLAFVQYFMPDWADGDFIARMSSPGRAGANLRQPNHLSSLLLLSMAALVWTHEMRVERRELARRTWQRVGTGLLMGLFALGVVMTVSRTGTVCIVLLALWGVLDRRMSPFTRRLLWALPVVYVACWGAINLWAETGDHAFAGHTQLHKSDLSSSRFGIWSNTLALLWQNPWFGVGWGQFNFAWTLTPFPGRPVAFFDHTHNLLLQILVEVGLPLGLLILGLLGWGGWRALSACLEDRGDDSARIRCAFVMTAMMMVHSQLEYPLWYAYFLLPTAFAFGTCLSARPVGAVAARSAPSIAIARAQWTTGVAAVVLALGATGSLFDYLRVVPIFDPDASASLSERIDNGERSLFFSHHAEYADVTTRDHPSEVMPAFDGATHFLLDTRLMMAWAKAYAEKGDLERARHLAQRLREFNNPASAEFFAECRQARAPGEVLPFQCTPPSRPLGFRAFE